MKNIATKFETYISKENLESFNKIITNHNLNIEDRKKAFLIAIYIKEHGLYNKTILSQFELFCSNEMIINKKNSKIINDIYSEILKINSSGKKEEIELLIKKISTIVSVGNTNSHLSDEEFFDLLNKILKSNFSGVDYEFIKKIFANDILKSHNDKRIIIFDVLTKKQVKYLISDEQLNSIIESVLTNEDVLLLDENYYKKVIEIVITYIQSYILNMAINNEKLTLAMKQSVIDYYYNILDKYLPKSMYIDLCRAKDFSEQKVFSIVNDENLISNGEEIYIETLNEIKKCKSPLAYVEVLMGDIDLDKKYIALDIINNNKNTNQTYDYKFLVSEIAVSKSLSILTIDEYKKLLLSIDNFCIGIEKIKDNNKRLKYINVINKISEVLKNTELIYEDSQKIILVLEQMMLSINERQFDSVAKFCNNPKSMYYTDSQYRRIVSIINKCSKYGYQSELLVQLFTNQNVPFMNDKSILFQLAQTEDFNIILESINKLNIEGHFNNNVSSIFKDVDEITKQEIEDTFGIKVKKIEMSSISRYK